ncbi:hypothetical protein G7050_02790 [Dysgonomonas sp. HDW5A]|uniref:hypothetical protein n=1 Tax=Dysgonomonas sp. HDW5A TaxID=2714926 RepID=UPI0014090138|nr:hypothetical protein [Dysgonomonas sp. HDW5A]QIK58825.1 hypothetical protein G7050_02790 [Dysgonomonas sp. HDW5A]
MSKFILFYDEIKELSLEELHIEILRTDRIKVKELKLVDLLHNNRSLLGVYVFFDENNNIVYIGKSSSRAILERLAGHLDPRPLSFFNNLLCTMTGKPKKLIVHEDMDVVYEKMINFDFLFIQFPDHLRNVIDKVEKYLVMNSDKFHNKRRSWIDINPQMLIKDIPNSK